MAKLNLNNPVVFKNTPNRAPEPRSPSSTKRKGGRGLRQGVSSKEKPLEHDKELERNVAKAHRHAKELATTTAGEKASNFPRKKSQLSQRSTANGHFNIFVDLEDSTYEVDGNGASHAYNTKAKLPLKLAPANSRLTCLTQEQAQKMEESDDDNDKENRNQLVDDEAEEASGAESEERSQESEADSEDENIPEDGENELPSTPGSHQRKIQWGRHAEPMFTPYRESGGSGTEDDGFNSLDDFIVSDNEDINYESSSFLLDDDDDELEKTPPKQRRRLVRGRRPVAGVSEGHQLKGHDSDHGELFSPHEPVSKTLDKEVLTKIGDINLSSTAHRNQNIMRRSDKHGNSDNILPP